MDCLNFENERPIQSEIAEPNENSNYPSEEHSEEVEILTDSGGMKNAELPPKIDYS